MCRIYPYLGSLLFLATLVASTVGTGCAVQATSGVRVYDVGHQDWHNWDDREERSYRQYLVEKHAEYEDFSKCSRNQQDSYWKWRHDHLGTRHS